MRLSFKESGSWLFFFGTFPALAAAVAMSANDPPRTAVQGRDPLPESFDAELSIRQRYGSGRFLVVDDVALNREVMTMLLEGAGLLVDTACDGEQAIGMARRTDYAAILMDIQMPKVDGLAATRQIRVIPGYRQTPIIAVTGYAGAEAESHCLAAGMTDFIAKPFAPDLLFATLLQGLDQCCQRSIAE
jgi:CheY-like chemotaxis protein